MIDGIKIVFLSLVSFLFFSGCNLIDNEQINPAFLVIDEVNLETSPSQGAPTHKFTDIWVSVDGFLLGVYELPARIPIIIENPTTSIRLIPGIRNNGEFSRAFSYQLIESIFIEDEINPGQIIEPDLVFKYLDNAIFDFVEGFEGSNQILTLDLDDDEESKVTITNECVGSETQSGLMELTSENPLSVIATAFSYDGDQNAGADTYLEMEYKNDVPFIVGLIYQEDGQEISDPIIALNPSDEWNKIYIDFTILLARPSIDNYRVFFTADLDQLNTQSGSVYFDNLKLVHL